MSCFDVPSPWFLIIALWGNNYPYFTEEETESEGAMQLVREVIFVYQYVWLRTTTWNGFSRDFSIHWRERMGHVWRQIVTGRQRKASVWDWGDLITLPQSKGRWGTTSFLLFLLLLWPTTLKIPTVRGQHLYSTLFCQEWHFCWKQASNFTLHNECLPTRSNCKDAEC